MEHNNLIIIYNLGNMNSGKVIQTESKAVLNTYIDLGYKLISVSWMTVTEYLKAAKVK